MWRRCLAFVMVMVLSLHTVPMTVYAEEKAGFVRDSVTAESKEESTNGEKTGAEAEQPDREEAGEGTGQEQPGEDAGQGKSEENAGQEQPGEGAGQGKSEENAGQEQLGGDAEQKKAEEGAEKGQSDQEAQDKKTENVNGMGGEDNIEGKKIEEDIGINVFGVEAGERIVGEYQPSGASYKLTYTEVTNGVKITGITGTEEGELKIPAQIDGKDVVEIGNYAFDDCDRLTGNLVIPDSVGVIGNNAFEGCRSLGENLEIRGASVIGEEAFLDCGGLTNISIFGSVREIKSKAFSMGKWGNEIFRQPIKITIYSKTVSVDSNAFGTRKFLYGYSGGTLERYAAEHDCAFGLIDGPTQLPEYRVTNTAELIDAIGSYRRIILADGIYEIVEKNGLGGIKLTGLISLSIEAEHSGKAEILCKPKDGSTIYLAPVVTIETCWNVKINGCILGHDGEIGACNSAAYVVKIKNASNIIVNDCDLYGCGSVGVYCQVAQNIDIKDCVVRDCIFHIASGSGGFYNDGSDIEGFRFSGCVMSGHVGYTHGNYYYAALNCPKELYFTDCSFLNNYSKTFDEYNAATVKNCKFYNNVWDGGTPQPSGICLNGITWQVEGDVLKLGFPLSLDKGTIQSKTGKVLDYSASSAPWKKCTFRSVQYAAGVEKPDKGISGGNGGGTSGEDKPEDVPSTGLLVDPVEPQTYTGAAVKPKLSVYYNGNLLTEKRNYTVSYRNNVNASASAPTITVTGKGKTKGKATLRFEIQPKDLSAEDVAAGGLSARFDGSAKKPVPVLSYRGKKLKAGKDYTVASGPCAAPGSYQLSVQGKGNYKGSKTLTFTITGDRPASKMAVAKIPGQTYQGSEVEPVPVVKDGKRVLTAGVDYSVSYQKNVQAGTAKLTLTGIPSGGYTGTKTVSFKIKPCSVKSAQIKVELAASYPLAPGGCKPEPVVTFQGKPLVKGVDYTLSYRNNKKASSVTSGKKAPAVVIKGRGNFGGSCERTFAITK